MPDRQGAFKLCIFGDGGVGKTTLVHRYLTKIFKEDLKMTIGADFSVKELEIDGKTVVLRIWDFLLLLVHLLASSYNRFFDQT